MNNDRNARAVKGFAIFGAAITYAAAVIYGDLMFLTVMRDALPDGMLRTFATFGAIATAASAILLPIAIHFWLAPGSQFLAGLVFWIADIVALGLNAILAYALTTDRTVPIWSDLSPATPLLAVLGWGLLFMLDPSHKLRHAQAGLQADQIDAYAKRLTEAAKSETVDEQISAAAQQAAEEYAGLLASGRPASNGRVRKPEPNNSNQSVAFDTPSTPALNPTPRRKPKTTPED